MGVFHGSKIKDKIRVNNQMIRECFAEFLGTFILCAFGAGSIAMNVLPPHLNSFLSVNLGWGLGAAIAVWCCGGVSGGHINPAVTLAMGILGRLPLIKIPVYWIGQYVGAFMAAACVFGVYYDGINNFDGGHRAVMGANATAGIFGTYPQGYVSTGAGLGDQIFGTMLLVLGVMAITDKNNIPCPKGLIPLAVGLLIGLIGMTFGQNCGFPINPARDLSPRLFTAIAGYGTEVFSAYNYYFWIPIVGPHIGALCGAWMYLVLVGAHFPKKDDSTDSDDEESKSGKLSVTHKSAV
jgi:MIP family channel proteins